MNPRQLKGLEIAQKGGLKLTPKGWIVPSQNSKTTYLVYSKSIGKTKCTCPDCELRGIKCKHQWAVEYYVKIEKGIDEFGNETITKTEKITYSQDWSNYTKAQNNEIKLFGKLLADLVKAVPEPTQTFGRPRLSPQESVFCAIQKVYSQLSSRRAHSIYTDSKDKEQIDKAPNYNSINLLLNKEDLTTILQKLLVISALPLKSVETKFAPDSSGFSTSQFGQYMIEKYGLMKKHKWIKAHILTGTNTNIIASARITEEYGADSPQFEPLVTEAYQSGFNMEEISADRGYSSRENYNLANKIGSKAYIPFKKNATGKSRGSYTWIKMFHYFQLNREEFMEHYHARSNVETTFMMVKMKFGEKLKSKKFIAQKNELLCKLIAHNIVVVIHEMYELGINPDFANKGGDMLIK